MDLFDFPSLSRGTLRALRQTIDAGFLDFTRNYGEALEQAFEPLRLLLIGIENLLLDSPGLLSWQAFWLWCSCLAAVCASRRAALWRLC